MSSKVSPRLKRIADQLQRELAMLIQLEVKDPRVGMVSVTGVDVSRDLAYATVYVTVMGAVDAVAADGAVAEKGSLDQLEIDESLKALNKAAGFLRSQLAKRLSLRTTPRLVFRYDNSISQGQYLSSLIDNAIAADSQHHHD
ncbi:MAG: 30S ribosome-binding factor RbfA [Pseudomonadales bacterium]|nr:30S ribosome-binding factor RbfA [Pseudomonadales bacterium]